MTGKQLQQLSKPELIEIILRQQALIEQLQARVAELEEQINRLTEPPKDASNSSIPPSKSPKANRSHQASKRGPKRGHQGHGRRRWQPDVTVECRPHRCARCGADLTDVSAKLLGTSQVVELPPIQPLIIEARRYQVTCPRCAHHQQADYPPGLGPPRTFSARLEALVCYFHHVQHVSYERLQKLMGQVFGLSISQGAIANIIRRAWGRSELSRRASRRWFATCTMFSTSPINAWKS